MSERLMTEGVSALEDAPTLPDGIPPVSGVLICTIRMFGCLHPRQLMHFYSLNCKVEGNNRKIYKTRKRKKKRALPCLLV